MNRQTWRGLTLALMLGASAGALASCAQAQAPAAAPAARPWLDPKLDADTRADLALKAMTQDEKLTIIFGYFGADMGPKYKRVPTPCPARPAMCPASNAWASRPSSRPTPASAWPPRAASPTSASAPPCPPASPPPPPGTRAGPGRRRDDRLRGPRLRLQRHAGRRRQPGPRAAQRPQLRIWRRGSLAGRPDGRGPDQGHPVQRHRLDHQALRPERPGKRPLRAGREDRRGRRPHLRPAGLPVRHRAVGPALGDVRLQQDQRPLRLRERLPAQQGAQAGLGLQGLRDVRLGRGPLVAPRRPMPASTRNRPARPSTSRTSSRAR
jgi:hypothetical protein